MNKRTYMKPMSEIVRIGSRRLILDIVHENRLSYYQIGSDGGKTRTGNGNADAKVWGLEDWMTGWEDEDEYEF